MESKKVIKKIVFGLLLGEMIVATLDFFNHQLVYFEEFFISHGLTFILLSTALYFLHTRILFSLLKSASEKLQRKLTKIIKIICFPLTMFYSFTCLLFINSFCDTDKGEIFNLVVSDKKKAHYSSKDHRIKYYATVEYPRKSSFGSHTVDLVITQKEYEHLLVKKDVMVLQVKPGALGLEWIAEGQLRPGG